jgi:hypothetical protein
MAIIGQFRKIVSACKLGELTEAQFWEVVTMPVPAFPVAKSNVDQTLSQTRPAGRSAH